jgi:hypothetical protein
MSSSVSNDIARVLDDAQAGRTPPAPAAALEQPQQAPSLGSRPASARASVWITILVAAVILFAYALLQNPYWVCGGDSEVYTCIARSLVQRKGFVFNGQPVAMVPPGWALLMAGIMELTSAFLALKLATMFLMAGAMIIFLFILRRFVPVHRAGLIVVLSALLAPVFQLTYWLHSEAMFCFLSAAALLVAFQINEGKRESWRMVLLVLLCALSVTARWTGILFWPVIGGALLRGEWRPRLERRRVAAFVSGAVTLAMFFGLRAMLRVPPEQIDPRYDSSLSVAYDLVNEASPDDTMSNRISSAYHWVGGLIWSPTITTFELQPVRTVVRVVSYALLGFFLVTLVYGVRRREWTWLGVLIYYGALCVNWPSPVARYMVPIAPLLLLGMFRGITHVANWFGTRYSGDIGLTLRSVFAGLVLIPNLAGFGLDVWAMRAPRFYERYQGGVEETLVGAAQTLRVRHLHDAELAVSRRFATPRRDNTMTNKWMRAASLLTNRAVMTMPDELSREPDAEVKKWMRDNHARYYLYLPMVYTYGHLRMLTSNGLPVPEADTRWRLYELRGGELVQLPVPPGTWGVTRVPGL